MPVYLYLEILSIRPLYTQKITVKMSKTIKLCLKQKVSPLPPTPLPPAPLPPAPLPFTI